MICPNCKSDMIVIEHHRIELDYCTECNGVWFDTGELDLMLQSIDVDSGASFLKDMMNSPEAESAEKKRKCPICARKMKKVTAGQKQAVIIDVCQQGDGLWFDGGELAQLINQMSGKAEESSQAQQQVTTFLGDVFKAQQ
jgi:Zn-finger nucleic acid-binding protein